MKKMLLLLTTSVTCYYLYKSKKNGKSKDKNLKKKAHQQNQKTEIVNVTPKDDITVKKPIVNDIFDLTGEYHWTFHLGPIKQVSTHILSADYIDYQMQGKAYNTDYRMQMISYDAEQQKWIGKADDDVVYVLFFKQHDDDSQLTIYKHKCALGDEGIQEANNFAFPEEDATEDHGWNRYSKKGASEPEDVLSFSGELVAEGEDEGKKVSITDEQVQFENKVYQKLSHHSGERRWVGQCDDEYLVVFYEIAESEPVKLSLSLITYQDLEEAYQSKHEQQTYKSYQLTD